MFWFTIDTDLYDRQGGALTNFQAVLPAPQSDLAQSLLKSECNLEFLGLHGKALERDLERALVEQMQKFLLELGIGLRLHYPTNLRQNCLRSKTYSMKLKQWRLVLRSMGERLLQSH